MHTNKGQIVIAVIGALSAVIASVFSAWGVANNRIEVIDTKIQEVDTKVQVTNTREEVRSIEITKRLDRMETKLDKLIETQITSSKK